MIIASLLPQLI